MRNRSQERPGPGGVALGGVIALVALSAVGAGVGLAASRSTVVVEQPMAPAPLCARYAAPLGPFVNVGSARPAYTCRVPRGAPAVVNI